jgi:hypothetical protein
MSMQKHEYCEGRRQYIFTHQDGRVYIVSRRKESGQVVGWWRDFRDGTAIYRFIDLGTAFKTLKDLGFK